MYSLSCYTDASILFSMLVSESSHFLFAWHIHSVYIISWIFGLVYIYHFLCLLVNLYNSSIVYFMNDLKYLKVVYLFDKISAAELFFF